MVMEHVDSSLCAELQPKLVHLSDVWWSHNVESTIITDSVSAGSNAVTSVRTSVRLFPLYLWNRLTIDVELLHVSRS